MAYVEHGMWEVLDVLTRIHNGEGIRPAARNTGRDRKTVKRYVETAEELGWVRGLHKPDEGLAQEVMLALRPGPKGETMSSSETLLSGYKEQIAAWLKPDDFYKTGLKLTKVHELLGRQGVFVSYSGLHRYAVKHLGFGEKRLTVRVADVLPGEVAEVDFGRLGFVPDAETGKRRMLHALVVTLVYSRHQYVYVTHSQKLRDLIGGLDDAWEFFGGVPKRVIVDNLKAAVTKADRYDPVFQRTFNAYAKHHGFVIDAAAARAPTHKPHVERQVKYVRDNFFRGEHFLHRDHAQREAARWCLKTAGMRTHGTTRRQPFIEFEAVEKTALQPWNPERFDTPHWAEPKVHPDCHIRFLNALYSVPYQHRGKKSTVCGDSKLVRIYIDQKLVKTYKRQPPGGRHTDYGDYPPDKSEYAMRDANYIIKKAKERGEDIGEFATQLLSGDFPWAHLRQSQKLMRLCDKYGNQPLNAACQRALAFGLINVRRLETIVKNALEAKQDSALERPKQDQTVVQLPLRFLRDNQSFKHQTKGEESK